MIRTFALCVLSALALAGCGDRPSERAGTTITGSAPSWQGPATAFTAPGWKVGDQGSWNQHMQTRTQGQNEFARIRPGS
jgi:hypothetical protein